MNQLTRSIYCARGFYFTNLSTLFIRQYAAKKAAPKAVISLGKSKKFGKGEGVKKVAIPVETDPKRLISHLCGSNMMKEGEDIEIKPDSEYPSWLWELSLVCKPLEELDPNTKTYWRRIRKMHFVEVNNQRKLKKF